MADRYHLAKDNKRVHTEEFAKGTFDAMFAAAKRIWEVERTLGSPVDKCPTERDGTVTTYKHQLRKVLAKVRAAVTLMWLLSFGVPFPLCSCDLDVAAFFWCAFSLAALSFSFLCCVLFFWCFFDVFVPSTMGEFRCLRSP